MATPVPWETVLIWLLLIDTEVVLPPLARLPLVSVTVPVMSEPVMVVLTPRPIVTPERDRLLRVTPLTSMFSVWGARLLRPKAMSPWMVTALLTAGALLAVVPTA